ncbi:hypothetical protein Droror1_Dr00006928 [Drosera rotundifolia]
MEKSGSGSGSGANEHSKQSNVKSIRLFGKEIFVASMQQEQERSVTLLANNVVIPPAAWTSVPFVPVAASSSVPPVSMAASSSVPPVFMAASSSVPPVPVAGSPPRVQAPAPDPKPEFSQPRQRRAMSRPTAEETKRARIPPPDLPDNFKTRVTLLGGRDPVLVIQKYVYKTDVNTYENRLSLPKNQIRVDFLTDEEKAMMEYQMINFNKYRREGLPVKVVDMWMMVHDMILKKWGERKNKNGETCWSFALISRWNEVAETNGLVVGDVIQLWAFRFDGNKLGLALVKLDADIAMAVDADAEDSNSESEGSS